MNITSYRRNGLATIAELTGLTASIFVRQNHDEVWLESQILPVGYWERNDALEIKQDHSTGITARSIHDLSRLDFLRTLGCSKIIHSALGGKRQYQAFIFCTASGKKVALVEADHTLNALYVFDASDPDWTELVSWSKWEVLQFGKPFLKRIYHRGNWQEQIYKLLSE